MKVKAQELKKGDKIKLAGRKCKVKSLEVSDIGKQGSKKVRIEAEIEGSDDLVIVRPADYPIEKI